MNTLKQLLFVGFLFFLATATGCKKKEKDATQTYLVNVGNFQGSYQWEYTLKEGGASVPDLPDHYGVVITESGNFYFYKNNTLQFTDKLNGINMNDPDNIKFTTTNQAISGNLHDSTLTLTVNHNTTPGIPYGTYVTQYYYDYHYIYSSHTYTNYFKKL